jgi:hypothetical protein
MCRYAQPFLRSHGRRQGRRLSTTSKKIDLLKNWADSLWEERQPELVPIQPNPLAGRRELDEIAGVLAQLHAIRLKAA